MQTYIWQTGSHNPANPEHLAAIRQWWESLDHKEVNWRQRILSGTTEAASLNWDDQRFDESFLLVTPQLRGITLYWRKSSQTDERSTTPHRLELDLLHRCLYVYPQSQPEVVIRIESKELAFRSLNLEATVMEYDAAHQILRLRDNLQQIEINAHLTLEVISQIQAALAAPSQNA